VTEQRSTVTPEDEFIDLAALWRAAWNQKFVILAITALIGVGSVIFALSLPNIYRSTALLTPVSQERPRGLPGLGGNLSAIAGLAGLNLGGSAVDNTTLGIQTLTSRQFLTEFAKRHELVVPLFAAKGWDLNNKSWIIDPEIYDSARKVWLRKVDPLASPEPTDWEIYEVFSKMVSVEQDPKTGLVRLSVDSLSPEMSKEWTDLLIKDLNSHMRARDLDEANRSVEYMEQRLGQTSVNEVRLAAIQLIEEQMKTAMLAEARPEYVFRVLDPPVVPLEKHAPRRSVLCIVITMVGGILVAVIATVYQLVGKRP